MNFKKIISMISVFCITAMYSCSTSEQSADKKYNLDPENPATVTIWHYYNGVQQENFDNAIIEFNETVGREKGIVIEAYNKGDIDELSANVLNSAKQKAGAEDMPDMFASYSDTAYEVDKLGYAVDLSEYFTEKELSEYIDGYIEEGKINSDNSLKIFPTAKSTEIMIINLTDWEKFSESSGVTTDSLKTWEGVVETAEKYYEYTDNLTPDVENDGKAFFGRDSIANYMIIGAKQLNAEFVTEKDGKLIINIDKTAVRKLWDNYYVPYVKGYFSAQSRYRSDDAKTGEIIALICSTTGSVYFPNSITIDDDYTYPIESLVLPVPNFEGTDPYIVQQGAGMVVVKSDEKTEYACTVFLKWFTEKEQNISFAVDSGYMPVKKDSNDKNLISSQIENQENNILSRAITVAIDEIENYNLYVAKPFDNISETREFLENYIQETAKADFEEIQEKISDGENRETVIENYISDNAFEKWFNEFSAGLHTASGLE